MKRRYFYGLAWIAAVALIPLGATAAGAAAGPAGHPGRGVAASSTPAFTGTFTSFPAYAWHHTWGIISNKKQCQGATSTAPCNWGYKNMKAVSDSTAPGTGDALQVTYPKNSGPPSCVASSPGCVLGGGQFYQNLKAAGLGSLAASPTVDLMYWYKFPVGFDFGRQTAGKMPGLYGGVPGCESGGQHCSGGWSTRYMWRGGSPTDPDGELYFYSAAGSGFGADLCLGNWHFAADGKWHSIEQLVNVQTGQMTIWSDGGSTPVCSVQHTLGTPVSGIFFSTFHGGHDTSWSPSHTTTDEFADFTLSTSRQGGSARPAAAAPARAPVTRTLVGGAKVTFTQADIDAAVAAPLISFQAPTSSVPRPGTNPVQVGQSKVLYYLALVDKLDPGATASNGTTVDSALLKQVENLVAGGNEPDADGGLEGWSHAPVAQALLLLKHGPAWTELSTTDRYKVSLLEKAMGYAGNYTYNDANDFMSGICGFGNFDKDNNPNYQDGYVNVELAAIGYFGATRWDTMLANFNDATLAAKLDSAGLTNAGGCYKTVGSAANSAIRPPFVWMGHPATDPMGIWSQLASDTFDQTVTSSVSGNNNGSNVTAHIADNSTSPEDGRCCMGHEFNSDDDTGLRSSALYVFEGWMNVTGSRAAMSAIGTFNCSAATSAAQYKVGTLDLVYKLHHGYISYGHDQFGVLVDDHGDPSTDGPNVKGYQYDLDAYNNVIAPQSC
ncbi:MAG TPA: hypothetical protein VGS19_29575 [Streptosporangiaceae bacterium]|nr:hypothetical protein [Streptosporangiaceae bacterium]